MKVVATSGYFDPLHVGHIECLELAKELGDELIVIVNSEYQAQLKKGKSFMNEKDRLKNQMKSLYTEAQDLDLE